MIARWRHCSPQTPHTSLTLEPTKSNIRKKSFAGLSPRLRGKHVTRVASDDAALFRRPEADRGPPESLGDKAPVSDMADGYQIQPSLIFLWVKLLLDQAKRAFRQPDGWLARAVRDPKDQKFALLDAHVAQQEAKLAHKHEVNAELVEVNVRAKKSLRALN